MSLLTSAAASRRRPDGAAGPGPSGGAGRRPPSLGPTPAGPHSRQSLRLLAAAFATLYCEFEAGRRPRRHLTSMATPLLVARLAAATVQPSTPATVARVLVAPVGTGAAEAVVVVRRGERYTALALRLLRTGDDWRIDDVARPELGGLPPAPFPMPADEEDGFAAEDAGLPQLACGG